MVLGKKYMKMEYRKDGTSDLHEVIPLGITLDERIADGYYYSGTVALVKELLGDEDRRAEMSRKLHEMVRLDSTERICDIVEELTKR